MNILIISNKATYPPDGGTIAILNLAKAYVKNGHKVHILNMVTHKHYNKKDIPGTEFQENISITGVKINTRLSILKALQNLLFSKKALIAERFISNKFLSELNQLLKNNSYDFIQFEGLYALQYINTVNNAFSRKTIYRPHNVEYIIWKRNSKETKSLIKKVYFKILYKRLKKLEISLCNTYDFIIPISYIDAKEFNRIGNTKPLLTAPFGIEVNNIKSNTPNIVNINSSNINFIGALDWIPNQKGLLWFIQKCMPEIIKEIPEIQLSIAGRNAPLWLIKKLKHKNIKYIGEVKNAYDFLSSKGPVIVPLFSGSGIRVKIIESMALKKVVIATNMAVQGIKCKNNENILIANTPNDFCKAVISTLKNPKLQGNIGENAFKFVKENFSMDNIALNILNLIKQ